MLVLQQIGYMDLGSSVIGFPCELTGVVFRYRVR